MVVKESDFWFAYKKFGWGWGFPVTWQGWLFYFVWTSILLPIVWYLQSADKILFLILFITLMAGVLIITYLLKGERKHFD